MNTEIMKNMIIIKNLPSNMIEEAWVMLKPNLKVKDINKVELQLNANKESEKKENNYVVKEAELLLAECISKIEKGDNIRKNSVIEKKYKKMKLFSVLSLLSAIIGILINILS